ncbi:hypothetical protein HYPDE_27263 [Hyphomicrobium denitrificans 1NES1]|uniref:DUF547 domain-containing protein n=1 Tax=Hyphomicrobium denitrificans 1NES1 TaxID=670307 RepID=N0B4I7_9HYPH|nr:DUF547 domain-containing protein [Hyphomicrobium denitrificans]AGK57132.1 hypothetical protein HYPDE_27263 [Hyphomicrobium denitrificans 1NES1]
MRHRRTVAGLIGLHASRIAVALGLTSMLLGPSVASPQANRSPEAWQSEWTQVLQRHVDAKGRVDFAGLASDRTGLDDVMKFVATADPVSQQALFPTPSARMAYYIDAYNALAMYGVLDAGVPERFGWLGRFRFFYLRKFILGGRSISLYSLENDVIRPMGDPRVHFALNCMSVSCPRLPRTAFTTDGLDRELDTAAREFMNEDRNVHVDLETHVVRLSAIFDFYTKDFLAKAPSLIAYVNRYRTVPVPVDFKVSFADYDWTINAQSRREEGAR